MIVYDLSCTNEHRFEGWFGRRDDFERQLQEGILTCPVCASNDVRRQPSPHHIARERASNDVRVRAPTRTAQADQSRQWRELNRKLHDLVERVCEDVGREFPTEARRIHAGEAEERAIRGIATAHEVKELHQEGVPVVPLPPRPVDQDKLN